MIRSAGYVCALLLMSMGSARAERMFAVDSRAVLVSFDSDRPGAIQSMAVIRGLQPGESILGIDFRPANKKLYALGSSNRIYVVDPATGAAAAVASSSFQPPLDGTKFGFNFNPTVDRIRIVSNRGQNLRAHPDTGQVVAVDGFLRYNDDAVPSVVTAAYTNAVAGATSTTLFDFDLSRRAIVTQNPPNEGRLVFNFQLKGADFSEVTGFDISPVGNKGYIATRETSAARVQLYEISFPNGTAMLLGTVGNLDQVSAITVAPEGMPALFTRLGGMTAISAVVDEFLANVVGDNRINKFFAGTVASPARVAALRQNLIDQVCEGSGGPCKYTGRDMKSAHQGMMIGDVEFDALVEDLVKALDRFDVPVAEKAALLGILSPMRGDIVGKKQMQMLGN